MLPSSTPLSLTLRAAVVLLWAASSCWSQSPSQKLQLNDKAVSDVGKRTYASTCAGCHGLDGRGGERAPNIAESPRVQRLSDSQISGIIENGIPGTGMPAFRSLGNSETKALVTYLRSLQGTKQTVTLPGNAERGQMIFFGKAKCSDCHMAGGKGGFIASDLSGYARTHGAEQIQSAITNPASTDRQARLATATMHGGGKYAGRVRNEDNFSLQLQTQDGKFIFILKSDLEGLEYDSKPLMPSDYGSTLTRTELDDVLSYLMSLVDNSQPKPKAPREFEEE